MLRPIPNPEEQQHVPMRPTAYRTGPNRYRLLCSMCGEVYYVDAETFRAASSAVLKGLNNPFCCEDCEVKFDWNFAE